MLQLQDTDANPMYRPNFRISLRLLLSWTYCQFMRIRSTKKLHKSQQFPILCLLLLFLSLSVKRVQLQHAHHVVQRTTLVHQQNRPSECQSLVCKPQKSHAIETKDFEIKNHLVAPLGVGGAVTWFWTSWLSITRACGLMKYMTSYQWFLQPVCNLQDEIITVSLFHSPFLCSDAPPRL